MRFTFYFHTNLEHIGEKNIIQYVCLQYMFQNENDAAHSRERCPRCLKMAGELSSGTVHGEMSDRNVRDRKRAFPIRKTEMKNKMKGSRINPKNIQIRGYVLSSSSYREHPTHGENTG